MAKNPDMLPELMTTLDELVDQSPNPHRPEEQERIKKAWIDRYQSDPSKLNALLKVVFDGIWDALNKEQTNGRVSSGGAPRVKAKRKVSRKAKRKVSRTAARKK